MLVESSAESEYRHGVIPLRQVRKAILSLGCRPNGKVTLGPTTTHVKCARSVDSVFSHNLHGCPRDVEAPDEMKGIPFFFQDRDETFCLRDRNHFETLSILKIKLLPLTPI